MKPCKPAVSHQAAPLPSPHRHMTPLCASADGAANFRFCAAANCSSGIPYFPVAAAAPAARGFAIGTENDAVLHAAFTAAAARSGLDCIAAADAELRQQMTAALEPVEAVAAKLAKRHPSWSYMGIDTSIAPGLGTPAMTSAYEALLGGGSFGGPGTLSISALITKVLKSLPVGGSCGCGGAS
jgi:hypothetical protein